MLKSIIWFLMWPVFIIIAYQFVKLMLKRFEKNLAKKAEANQAETSG